MTPDAQPRTTAARRRLATAVWLGALLAVAGPVQAASRPIEVENIWVGLGSTNTFKVGTWTPVWVQLRGGDARFEGFMEVMVADDDGTPTSYFTRIDVGAKASQGFPAYIRPGARDPDLTIRLYDRDRRRVATVPQEAVLPQPPVSLMPQETMIVTMGRPQGLEAVPQLPGFQEGAKAARVNPGSGEQIVLTRLDPRMGRLPGRWYGYDAARTIVLDTADPEVIKSLDGMRGQPLVDWVRRGGHLVVSVGANWQSVKDSALGPILPGVPAGQEQVSSLANLEVFAGASKPIVPVGATGSSKILVTKLDEVAQRGGKSLASVSNLPLVVRGPCGFGRVTLITLDVDQKMFAKWPDRALFWARAVDLRPHRADPGTGPMMIGGPGRFNRWVISDLGGQLRAALEQFPGVRLIPFGWVAFFIFLYILLIGPGDYFFLKKVLKRMELTWITFPAIVIAVSLLAYYAAYVFKGNDLLVNQIEVVDVDQVAGLGRGETWAGLFSPQNRDYSMRVLPLPLDREPPPEETSSSGDPPRPAPGTEVIMSWFSSPEDQFGAMGNSSRRFTFGNGGYAYGSYSDRGGVDPSAGAVESLQGMRIPIWSTKCVTARWFGPSGPLLDAELRPVGLDRLSGTVTNRLDIPLEDAIVAFANHVYLVGKIAPHQTVRVELASDRDLSGYLRDKRKGYFNPMQYDPESRIDRVALMLDAMFHDSESRVGNERPLANDALHELDLTGQLALPRPMLAARVSRPASRLILDNAPSPPKIDRTTLVRVILPLQASSQ